jgi:hypothetical protein
MILCSFLFEIVSSFSPRVVVQGHQASLPAVCRWVALLPRQGGGGTNESFYDEFFAWLSWNIPVIEDYPYAGIDFSRYPKILVPPGEERGGMGKFASFFFCETYIIFMLFYIYHFFIPEYLIDMCLLCVDVGPVRPTDYARNRHCPRPGAAPAAAGGPTTT